MICGRVSYLNTTNEKKNFKTKTTTMRSIVMLTFLYCLLHLIEAHERHFIAFGCMTARGPGQTCRGERGVASPMTRWFKLFIFFTRVYLIRFGLIDGISPEIKYRFFKPLLHYRQIIQALETKPKTDSNVEYSLFVLFTMICLEFSTKKMFTSFSTKKKLWFFTCSD